MNKNFEECIYNYKSVRDSYFKTCDMLARLEEEEKYYVVDEDTHAELYDSLLDDQERLAGELVDAESNLKWYSKEEINRLFKNYMAENNIDAWELSYRLGRNSFYEKPLYDLDNYAY